MEIEQFMEYSAFAKQVETKDGPAILIGGRVIHVSGPEGTDWVDVVSRSFRRLPTLKPELNG